MDLDRLIGNMPAWIQMLISWSLRQPDGGILGKITDRVLPGASSLDPKIAAILGAVLLGGFSSRDPNVFQKILSLILNLQKGFIPTPPAGKVEWSRASSPTDPTLGWPVLIPRDPLAIPQNPFEIYQ